MSFSARFCSRLCVRFVLKLPKFVFYFQRSAQQERHKHTASYGRLRHTIGEKVLIPYGYIFAPRDMAIKLGEL